jgi:N-acetylglucosamine kinase-like BadF-type ATPase
MLHDLPQILHEFATLPSSKASRSAHVGLMSDLLIGADVGGSSARVAVATLERGILASARGGVGNPNVVGLVGSAAVIRGTMTTALQGVSGSVVAVVIGLAGGTRALNDQDYARAVLADGVGVPARIVSDVNVAFSSATPAEEGYAMIAGTGAVAGRVAGAEVDDRRDGWGWLVGDRGSGFWLGRAAVQSTLQHLDDGGPLSALHEAVLTAVGANLDQGRYVASRELVRACYAEPPIRLARLAPLVSEHAPTDPVAAALADRAAELLTATLLSLRPEPGLPVVLGGSVLNTPGPISDRVRRRIGHLPNPVLTAFSGLVGATWLAARSRGVADPAIHRRLLETATPDMTGERA